MGIHNFFKIRYGGDTKNPKIIEDLGEKIKIEQLSGLAIVIDAYPIIHAAIRGMQRIDTLTAGGKKDIKDSKITSHISVVFYNAVQYRRLGIKQLWVFDGGPPTIKICELKKRKEAKEKAKTEAKECKDTERIHKLEKRGYEFEDYIITDIKKLLSYMGIPWAVAPEEAEAYCAYLNKKDKYDYVLSPDSDALVFGSKKLIRPRKEGNKKVFYIYERKRILKKLKLDDAQFIRMAVCMGSDFAEKVDRIGPATVVNKIKDQDVEFNKSQNDAIQYYETALSNKALRKVGISDKEFHEPKLIKFLVEKNGFSLNRIEKHIESLK